MKWQPIETAPKNGLVLLYFPATKPTRENGVALSERLDVGYPRGHLFRLPTHWMPLPEPPA